MDFLDALEALEPEDLFSVWRWIDRLERTAEISSRQASLWKREVFGLMAQSHVEQDQPN
jgi:hypothetical protein